MSTIHLLKTCHLRNVRDLTITIDIIKTNRLQNRSSSPLPLRLKIQETSLDQMELTAAGYLLAMVVVVDDLLDPEVAVWECGEDEGA
jgi:hypothetical protein